MFKLTKGQGFSVVLSNDWEVSVQWSAGNYCDNRTSAANPYDESNPEYGKWQSKTAELSAYDVNGEPWQFSGFSKHDEYEEVLGYCSVEQVLEFISAMSEITKPSNRGELLGMELSKAHSKSFKAMERWERKWLWNYRSSGSGPEGRQKTENIKSTDTYKVLKDSGYCEVCCTE